MGATTVNPAIVISDNMSGSCTISVAIEYYNTASGNWEAQSALATPFITSTSGTGFDVYLDGVDAASQAYRPETSIDCRITATMPDSLMAADKTTIQDAFTITIQDECKNDQLTFTSGQSTSSQGFLVGAGPSSGFQSAYT